jgi:hypothetical protein
MCSLPKRSDMIGLVGILENYEAGYLVPNEQL